MAVLIRLILDWLVKGVATSLAPGCRERQQELPRRGQSFQPDRIGGAYVPADATSCASRRIDPETAIAFQAYRTMQAHFGATAAAHALPCIETDAPRQQTRRSRQPVCHQHVAFLRFPCRMRILLMTAPIGQLRAGRSFGAPDVLRLSSCFASHSTRPAPRASPEFRAGHDFAGSCWRPRCADRMIWLFHGNRQCSRHVRCDHTAMPW
jgi:hypothetical protein